MRNRLGFTLVELMVVIVIIGILAAISIAGYTSLKENAERSSCISNQRNIVEAATLYIAEQGIVNTIINVTILQAGNYINTDPSECPASDTPDFDDYTITIQNQHVDLMRCDVEPVDHLWTGFK